MKQVDKQERSVTRRFTALLTAGFLCALLLGFPPAAPGELLGVSEKEKAFDPRAQNTKTGASRTVELALPASAGGQAVAFRTENMTVEVFWKGERLFSSLAASAGPGTTQGDLWHFAELPQEAGGGTLTVVMTPLFSYGSNWVREFYCGPLLALQSRVLRARLPGFILCVAIAFLGVALALVSEVLSANAPRDTRGLVGLFAALLSLWSCGQTGVPQILWGRSFLLVSLGYVTLPLAAACVCAMMYEEAERTALRRAYFALLCLNLAQAALVLAGELSGKAAFVQSIFATHVLLGVTAAAAVADSVFLHRSRKSSRLLRAGWVMLAVTAALDLMRCYLRGTDDYSRCTRVGLMIYLLCAGAQYGRHLLETTRIASEARVMERMAYTDVLTGLANRPAMLRDLAPRFLPDAPGALAVAQFDVNDLKQTNDTCGHSAGDQLLRTVARLLTEAFSGVGTCYRCGGDEFVAVATGTQPEAGCKSAILRLRALEQSANEANETALPVCVAAGMAVCLAGSSDAFDAACRAADAAMYENKRALKSEREGRLKAQGRCAGPQSPEEGRAQAPNPEQA